MASTSYAVVVVLACMPYSSHSHAAVQVAGAGSLMRAESGQRSSDLQGASKAERAHDLTRGDFPDWDKLFEGRLSGVTFVQIGASDGVSTGHDQGDPIYDFAMKHSWRGVVVEPNPTSFAKLAENYRSLTGVLPIQLALDEKDGKATLHHNGGTAASEEWDTILPSNPLGPSGFTQQVDVDALTLSSFWKRNIVNKYPQVDILVVDVEGAEWKVLKDRIPEPKPRFILFQHKGLNRPDYKAIDYSLENQGYKYSSRDAVDSLYENKYFKGIKTDVNRTNTANATVPVDGSGIPLVPMPSAADAKQAAISNKAAATAAAASTATAAKPINMQAISAH